MKYVEIMDTTLRDGEQTQGVAFSAFEKLSIAKALLEKAGVGRIEVGSARVSAGELEAVRKICKWAKEKNYLDKVEVLGYVDKEESLDWLGKAGCNVLNLLVKGSLKHLQLQLRKDPELHFKEIEEVVDYASEKGVKVNVYLEDWSSGMKDSKEYILQLMNALEKINVGRIMLCDTLGILSPAETREYVEFMVKNFPEQEFDFHGHNDYGLALANSLEAVNAGCRTVHVTVNGLGERAGNTALSEVVVAINDKLKDFKCNADESHITEISRIVERFSGKKVASNKPISGADVFTQTAGIHADGDKKASLYQNPLLPERFGREREYALGKLSGKASLDHNLEELGIDLSREDKKKVLQRIVQLGDKKETITANDLPYIIADVLQTPAEQKLQIKNLVVSSGIGMTPTASFTLKYNGKEFSESSVGDGGYDAFMNALRKVAAKIKLSLPQLADYEVIIPPGGKTDALVETTITWEQNGKRFRTIGVDSDQLMAAVKATEKMLNIVCKNNI